MQQKAFLAYKIFTGTEWLTDHAVLVTGNRIDKIIPVSKLHADVPVKYFGHTILAPAFIDIQIYGANGRLFSAFPDTDSLSHLFEYNSRGGAALCLPTVATNTKDTVFQAIDAVRAYWDRGGKGVWGLHLEGPWINPVKRGAHLEKFIHVPEPDEVKELLEYGEGVIRMITLAPEVCSNEIIALLRIHDILISAGHSNATYDQATDAFKKGIGAVTHLYNAMSSLEHRAPGLVGAVLDHQSIPASIIVDGYHVDFAAIRIAKRIMGQRLFVISDAVTETSTGPYRHQRKGDRYESEGTLSGSAQTMHSSLVNLVNKAGIELSEALRMCSLYPARVLGCEQQYGRIAPGSMAQFVVLTKNLELVDVVI